MNCTNKGGYIPERGDIVWLSLDPRTGYEQSGRRPAVVLSPSLLSRHTGLAIVCPITSKVKGLPFEVVITGKIIVGAVLPIHVRSIDIQARKVQFIERISSRELQEVTKAVQALITSL